MFNNFKKIVSIISIGMIVVFATSCSGEKFDAEVILSPATTNPVVIVEDESLIVLSDLGKIAYALEEYKLKYRQYPISSNEREVWGAPRSLYSDNSEWIHGLVPEFLPELPRDPRKSDLTTQQYMYKSNGANYKLISATPDDIEKVKKLFPLLIDPMRPDSSYGYWTENAHWW